MIHIPQKMEQHKKPRPHGSGHRLSFLLEHSRQLGLPCVREGDKADFELVSHEHDLVFTNSDV